MALASDVIFELIELVLPFWFAVLVGVLVGWAWRPKWAKLSSDIPGFIPEGGGAQQSLIGFASFATSVASMSSFKRQWPGCVRFISDFGLGKAKTSSLTVDFSFSKLESETSSIVNVDDVRHLHKLFEKKDNGPAWIQMMNKSTNGMSYQAWRRDTETGPPQYCSRTVYEDAVPELLRDFFWDDEFRLTWDDMLACAETLEECPTTGTTVVRWVRKFPFFCSDREYVIGRRIWESGQAYYCVTKGVPSSSVPRRDKPKRVDLYYSSWCIRAAESKRDGLMTACEVVLFHYEDMGIPWEIAKLGVRQGMWGAVRKIEPAVRAYQRHRATGSQLSRSALLAQINTKVDLESPDPDGNGGSGVKAVVVAMEKPRWRTGIPRMVAVGGAVALALTLDRGLLSKALVLGVARRFANSGGKLL